MKTDIFEQYNDIIQMEFENVYDELNSKEQYENLITEAREKFEKSRYDNVDVADIIKRHVNEYGIDETLERALITCDMYLPFSLIDIMHEQLGFSGIKDKIDEPDRPEADKSALINSLTGLENADIIPYLVDFVISSDSELLKESAIDVIAKSADKSEYESIIKDLEKNGYNEDLLTLLVAGFKNTPDDKRILDILKNRFPDAQNKAYIAGLMADLGHAKAIPFLRGYVDKHKLELSRIEVLDIADAINRLGGKADDLSGFIRQGQTLN